MHLLGRPENGIHRTGLDAQGTADAGLLVDDCHRLRFFDAPFGIWGQWIAPQQIGEGDYRALAARRTAIDLRLSACYGLRVGTASCVAALTALRLR